MRNVPKVQGGVGGAKVWLAMTGWGKKGGGGVSVFSRFAGMKKGDPKRDLARRKQKKEWLRSPIPSSDHEKKINAYPGVGRRKEIVAANT